MISHLIPIIATWHLVYREICKYKPENVSKNITDLLHSTIFLLHYNNEYDLSYATQVSIGFYIYDSMHMLKFEPLNRIAKHMLYHALTTYMLNVSITVPKDTADSILYAYSILEMSNIGLYANKHITKEFGDKAALILVCQAVEFMWYAYFRVFKLTAYMMKISADAFSLGIEVCIILAMIYGMGLVWSYKLLMVNVRNKVQLKKLVGHES